MKNLQISIPNDTEMIFWPHAWSSNFEMDMVKTAAVSEWRVPILYQVKSSTAKYRPLLYNWVVLFKVDSVKTHWGEIVTH